jgi:hydrogenase maturation protease HycI
MEFLENEAPLMRRPVLIGMGNEINGDDGAGVYVVREVGKSARKFHIIDAGTQPDNFTTRISSLGPSHSLFIDAGFIDGPPGAVSLLPPENINEALAFHTHYIPLNYVIRRIQKGCGCRVVIIGIKPASLEPGDGLSRAVKEAADRLIDALLRLDRSI